MVDSLTSSICGKAILVQASWKEYSFHVGFIEVNKQINKYKMMFPCEFKL